MRLLKVFFSCGLLLILFSLTTALAAPPRQSTAEILEQLGGYPCPDSDFTCVKLSVPLDHFDATNSETIDVVFGVLPATGERKGMFITATGGPGSSGLASADSYTGAFDPSIPEHFDIVFFDQRGTYQSGDLQCPTAAATYYQSDARADTPEQEANVISSARTFVESCIAEMGVPTEELPYYGTRQAVEDLDTFRQAIGDEQIWLYGESYGTQYAQEYTATHPSNVAALILDGTVDLTLSGIEYYLEQAQAFNDVLVATLNGCTEDETCSADVEGGDALAVYDDMRAELATSPVTFQFPLPSGERAERSLTLSDLEVAAAGYVYSETSRMMLQRAIAAASHGNLVPLARTVYDSLGLDPETLAAIPDPTYSDALFYAVECNDYNYFSGTADERAEAYIRAGDEVEKSNPRFGSIFYGDLPCAFWPGEPETERPAALAADNIPTLVLGATADPATPVENGKRVFENLDDGYLVTTEGGAHVIFGRGDACPDELVTAFLVDDQMPKEREIRCDGQVASDYLANAPANAADYADPLEAMDSLYTEIYYLPEYYYWDQFSTESVGCTYGGTMTFEATDTGATLTFDECAFSNGFAVTGTGVDNYYGDGTAELDVTVSGLADGKLTYTYDSEGNISVTGTYDDAAVDLSY
jgi:pimeloyl-ACP methyl ester carboxylesterase